MANLKEKEVSFISELLTYEESLTKKLCSYACCVKDAELAEELKSLCEKTKARSKCLYNTL